MVKVNEILLDGFHFIEQAWRNNNAKALENKIKQLKPSYKLKTFADENGTCFFYVLGNITGEDPTKLRQDVFNWLQAHQQYIEVSCLRRGGGMGFRWLKLSNSCIYCYIVCFDFTEVLQIPEIVEMGAGDFDGSKYQTLAFIVCFNYTEVLPIRVENARMDVLSCDGTSCITKLSSDGDYGMGSSTNARGTDFVISFSFQLCSSSRSSILNMFDRCKL